MEISNQEAIAAKDTEKNRPPIFILGVPRSGTTLLRMMMDSHPEIMCGPEAQWIANQVVGNAPSISSLTTFLTQNKWGAVKGFKGVDEDLIYRLMAQFIDELMSVSARSHGKQIWAEKTPRNIIAVPFLYRLFPQAKFIHIYRDGRDVALSTIKGKWKTIPYFEKDLKNNYNNALKRWVDWNQGFWKDAGSIKLNYLSVKYEDLAVSPEIEIKKILDFVGVEWSDRVLNPYDAEHDVITMQGEGMKSFYNRKSIDTSSLYRWKQQLNWFQKRVTKSQAEDTLLKLGYEPTN